jgi:hypothetical protein
MYNHILEYSNRYTQNGILTIFLICDTTISEPYSYDKETHILRVKAVEHIKNIYHKTICAIKYCLDNFNFKYIIRTNISSFWNYKKLHLLDSILHGDQLYGYKIRVGQSEFISGYCMIMSPYVAKTLYTYRDTGNTRIYYDDVNISKICVDNGITLGHIDITYRFTKKCDISYAIKMIEKTSGDSDKRIFYRVKTGDRDGFDLLIFRKLSEIVYKIIIS